LILIQNKAIRLVLKPLGRLQYSDISFPDGNLDLILKRIDCKIKSKRNLRMKFMLITSAAIQFVVDFNFSGKFIFINNSKLYKIQIPVLYFSLG